MLILGVSTDRCQFVSVIKCWHFRFIDYKNFSRRHRLHFFVDKWIRSSFSYFSPLNFVIDFPVNKIWERFVIICKLEMSTINHRNELGYKYNLSYKETNSNAPKARRNRRRNVTWFNPPYSKNEVSKCFLSLIITTFLNPTHSIKSLTGTLLSWAIAPWVT